MQQGRSKSARGPDGRAGAHQRLLRAQRPSEVRSAAMKLGLQIPRSRGPADPRNRPHPRAHRAPGRRGRLDSIWVMDHFFQIRGIGPDRGADARGHDRPRLHGRPTPRSAPRPDGRRRPLPPARPMGEGHDDARRPLGRPRLAGHRRRLERGRVAQAWASRSRRSASASSSSRRRSRSPTGCGRASAAPRGVRGPPHPGHAAPELPAVASAGQGSRS